MFQKAILYMLLSAACFAVLNGLIRYVDYLPTFELVFFRSVGSVVCCLFVLRRKKISLLGNRKGLLILRALVGLTSMALFYKALQLMPMASAVSLRYLSPFFAGVLAIIFLKERVRPLQWLFYLTAFGGVVLLKGFDTRISLLGLGVIMLSALISGSVYVVIRKIGNTEHPVVVVNYFLTLATLVGGIISIFNWVTPKPHEWPLLLSMGFFGFIAQLFMTKALQSAEANLIAPFKYAEVIFTLFMGWIIFGEYQTLIAMAAMVIIILSLLGNVYVKRRSIIKHT